ncbi:hypothetical protein HYV74_02015 [Candidatus Uhrbacteria bacterium]|nr:hypothetical protein [Candidatus Uhrbacteria bacterium]
MQDLCDRKARWTGAMLIVGLFAMIMGFGTIAKDLSGLPATVHRILGVVPQPEPIALRDP